MTLKTPASVIAAATLIAALTVSGCGRKGDPATPAPEVEKTETTQSN